MNKSVLFDSHCHLQDERLRPDLDAVMRRAADAGVARMLCCATGQTDWDEVLQISRTHSAVIPAFGVHPWYLDRKNADWLEVLEKLLAENPNAAVGEIGIDHAVDPRNDADQDAVFIAQLQLARKYHRPVSVHCRKAWKSLTTILSNQGGLPDGGVIHSYSGPPDLISPLSLLGCSFSFSGSITRSFNKRGVASLLAVPKDRLLLETDSPDIVPDGVTSEVNEPANITLVAQAAARILEMPYGVVCDLAYNNGMRIFK